MVLAKGPLRQCKRAPVIPATGNSASVGKSGNEDQREAPMMAKKLASGEARTFLR